MRLTQFQGAGQREGSSHVPVSSLVSLSTGRSTPCLLSCRLSCPLRGSRSIRRPSPLQEGQAGCTPPRSLVLIQKPPYFQPALCHKFQWIWVTASRAGQAGGREKLRGAQRLRRLQGRAGNRTENQGQGVTEMTVTSGKAALGMYLHLCEPRELWACSEGRRVFLGPPLAFCGLL